jgi:hypothetical protein
VLPYPVSKSRRKQSWVVSALVEAPFGLLCLSRDSPPAPHNLNQIKGEKTNIIGYARRSSSDKWSRPSRCWKIQDGDLRSFVRLPDPMSDFIKGGEWGPGFNAQNEMLDAFSEK